MLGLLTPPSRRFSRLSSSLALLGLLTVTITNQACSAGAEDEPEGAAHLGSQNEELHGVANVDNAFPAVALVRFPGGQCTGTLINPQVVLTAAHCVMAFAQGCQTEQAATTGTTVVFGNGVAAGTTFNADDVMVQPGSFENVGACTLPGGGNHPQGCANLTFTPPAPPPPAPAAAPHHRVLGDHVGSDVALVHLTRPVPAAVATRMRVLTDAGGASADLTSGAIRRTVPWNTVLGTGATTAGTAVGFGFDDRPQIPNAAGVLVNPPSQRYSGQVTFPFGPARMAGGATGSLLDRCTNAWTCNDSRQRPDPVPAEVSNACPPGSNPEVRIETRRTGASQNGPMIDNGDSGGPLLLQGGTGPGQVAALPNNEFIVVGTLTWGNLAGRNGPIANGDNRAHYAPTFANGTGAFIERAIRDWDGDGIANELDNCPAVANANQANCNETAEVTLGQAVLGDACDPVPCPGATARISQAAPCSSYNPVVGQMCSGTQIEDILSLRTVGSSPIMPAEGSPQVVAGVTTHARFCQQNRALGFDCVAPANILRAQVFAAESKNDPARPWHRVTLGAPFLNDVFLWGSRGDSLSLDYGRTNTTRKWNYAGDNAFWTAGGFLPPAEDQKGCEKIAGGGCLNGTMWLFGDTNVGNTVLSVGGVNVGQHGANLSSSFVPMIPEQKIMRLRGGRGNPIVPFFLWKTLPDPAPYIRTPLRDIFESGQTVVLAAGQQGGVFAVMPDGQAMAMDDLVSGSIAKTLATADVHWASAVEADTRIGASTSPAVAIALSGDGTKLLAAAIPDKGGALVVSGETKTGLLDVKSLSTPSTTVPSARADFHGVYSRAAGGVFVIGGNSAGKPMSDVWFQPIGGAFREIKVSTQLGRVTAATYSHADSRLWLVDESLKGDTIRLLRVDVTTGKATIVGSWPRLGIYDKQFLSLDQDGAILLTGSSSSLFNSITARIAPIGGSDLLITLMAPLPGALVAAPVADVTGVRYLVDAGKESGPKTTLVRDLVGLSIKASELKGLF